MKNKSSRLTIFAVLASAILILFGAAVSAKAAEVSEEVFDFTFNDMRSSSRTSLRYVGGMRLQVRIENSSESESAYTDTNSAAQNTEPKFYSGNVLGFENSRVEVTVPTSDEPIRVWMFVPIPNLLGIGNGYFIFSSDSVYVRTDGNVSGLVNGFFYDSEGATYFNGFLDIVPTGANDAPPTKGTKG